ncbi:hypothetical protein MASR2M15_16670 [Anaerolineales bacterium]
MEMTVLLVSILINSIVLFIVFRYLYHHDRAIFLKSWAWAWAFNALRYFFSEFNSVYTDQNFFLLFNLLAGFLASLFIIKGITELIEAPITAQVWLTAAFGGFLLTIILYYIPDTTLLITAIQFSLIALATLLAGWILLQDKKLISRGKRWLGLIFLGYGLFRFSYPLLLELGITRDIRLAIAAMFDSVIAIGFLLIYFNQVRRRLEISEFNYRSIVQNAVEGFFRSSLEGHFIEANQSLVKMLGYESQEELCQIKIPEELYWDPSQRQRLIERYQQIGIMDGVEVDFLSKTGEIIPVALYARIWQDRYGKWLGYEGAAVDLRPQKHGEDLINSIIGGTVYTQGKEFFEALVENLATGLGCTYAMVGQLKDTQVNFLAVWDQDKIAEPFSCHIHNTPCTEIIETEKLVYYPRDMQILFPDNEIFTHMQIETFMGIPLKDADNQIIGILAIMDKHHILDTKNARSLLQIFAGRAGAEINRRESEASLKEQYRLAQALSETAHIINTSLEVKEVLNLILVQVGKILTFDTASILLVDGQRAYFSAGLGFERHGFTPADLAEMHLTIHDHPNLRTMFEDRIPIIIHDTRNTTEWEIATTEVGRWIRSNIATPIIIRDQVIGFLNLDAEEPHAYTYEQARMLIPFAMQAGIAIDNARLFEAVRNYAVELENKVHDRTTELLIESTEKQIILENVADAIIMTDANGIVQFVNKGWENISGYELSETIGLDSRIMQKGSTPKATYLDLWRTIEKGHQWHGILNLYRKDGTPYDADFIVTPVKDKFGVVQNFVAVKRDVTLANRLELQRERFVANAAHELRTPITNFQTRIYLARKQPEQIELHLDSLQITANLMERLVADLLDLSRFESGDIPISQEKIDMLRLISQSIQMQSVMAEEKEIELRFETNADHLWITGDADRMTQVISNLLVNAIHYTPKKGEVKLLTYQSDSEIVIEVYDNGEGIDQAHMTNIFLPFYRASSHKVGTGLGLSIAKEIVEKHGGKIQVSSIKGQGSCFSIILPIYS